MVPRNPVERFRPRTLPGRGRRAALLVAGPALWLLALVGVDVVESGGSDLDTAFLIVAVTTVAAFVILLPGAVRRRRRLVRGR